MKASHNCIFLVLVLINAIAFSQPGYYPPPSSVIFHNDTLTISPPDSLPGEPTVLLGYNIYVDSIFFENINVTDPEAAIDFIFDDQDLLPGTHEFCAKALYNDWISETECDTGQVIYGVELPFLEDWSSGGFEENLWTTASGNWVIGNDDGNPAPDAEFRGNPVQTDYEMSLESYPINALGIFNGKIWLDFDIRLETSVFTATEFLKVQVWNWTLQTWQSVAEYSSYDGNLQWSSEHINIRPIAMNKIFKVRFLASGLNSSDITNWSIDNIHIYRQCDGIYDLQLEEQIDFNRLDWWGYGGSCIDEWLHWDDGVNSGNSIGTGGSVEFDVAARWDHEQLSYLGGLVIDNIAFFPAESSASYSVRIWSGEGPDTLMIDQPVNSPVMGQWNYVTLNNPLIIDITKDLWVGYHVETPTGYPAGVDDGPAIDGYGNMMFFEGEWQTLLEINPELDYNWNIACHAGIGPPPPDPDWIYNIYRKTNNSEFEYLGSTPGWHYKDSTIILEDFYCYAVTAVWTEDYDTCESSYQEIACEVLMLGTGPEQQESQIRIYPNPAQTVVNVTSDEEIREVRVYSTLGEKILKLEIGNSVGVLDVSGLKNGIYFVEVLTENQVAIKKILIFR